MLEIFKNDMGSVLVKEKIDNSWQIILLPKQLEESNFQINCRASYYIIVDFDSEHFARVLDAFRLRR